MQTEILNKSNNQEQFQNCSDLDIFEMLSSILVTMAKSEQILQCIRQVLVLDPNFTPMSLFKYLAGNSPQLYRKNITNLLCENNLVSNQKQTDDYLKRIFNRYGISTNNGIQYTSYLSFIYPFNSSVLRDLLANRIKKYSELDKINKSFRPSQSVITAFLLLIQQQIKVQKRIEVQINDPRFPGRDRLKKAIKSIKKASQKISSTITQKSQNHISMLQLRNFIKAFMEVQDHLFLDLSRRLGLNKSGNISLQNLENALRKNKKPSIGHQNNRNQEEQESSQKEQKDKQNVNNCSYYKADKRIAKQNNFRQELYKQLDSCLKSNTNNRNKTPRNKSVPKTSNAQQVTRNKHRNYGNGVQNKPEQYQLDNVQAIDNSMHGQNFRQITGKQFSNFNHSKQKSGNQMQTHHESKSQKYKNLIQKSQNFEANRLFKQFIETFLKGHRQIQKCKSKLALTGSIDFLSLFKTLDNGRGVVDSQTMQKFYTKLSGIPTDYDFQLIIDRFAQPEEKWLSYTQFSDIFRCPTSKVEDSLDTPSLKSSPYHQINGVRFSQQSIRLIAQIIYLTLDLEYYLRQILNKFRKSDIQWLFGKINVDSQSKGFINYQQLKKYLAENLSLSVPMIDLMSLLKRLDKSKNGVVLRQQFLLI